jgi:histidinol-phosphatase (PHP family)
MRCKHASGDVVDYARAAHAAGLAAMGASDHSPLPGGAWEEVRMDLDELPAYEAAVALARREVPELRILLGMECDIGEAPSAYWTDQFLARGYDYLIASVHYVSGRQGVVSAFEGSNEPETLRDLVRRTVWAIEDGRFAFVAHPDVFGCCNLRWNVDCRAAAKDICAAAAARRVPLELNSLGLRRGDIDTPDGRRARYPWLPFWEVAADCGVPTVISTDAHHPKDIAHGLDRLLAMAAGLGLTVVDPFAS